MNASETGTPQTVCTTNSAHWPRYIPLLVWLISIVAIVALPLGILSHGYLPYADGLRHAAKPLADKSWPEILVFDNWVTLDHNPGWHVLLGAVHQLTNWGPDGLVAFSLLLLLGGFCLVPLIWIRRPEAWLAVLLIVGIAMQTLLGRLTCGRPFTISSIALICMLFLWNRASTERPWKELCLSTVLIAMAAWMHGSWYLFALPIIAFAAAQQWRTALWISGAWIIGSFVGAALTGHPIEFLGQAVQIAARAFSEPVAPEFLVTEYRPLNGNFAAVAAIAVVLLWRVRSGVPLRALINNPAFLLTVLAWILGLRVARFWFDWGLPAAVVWLALQLEEPVARFLRSESWQRLAFTAGCAAAVVIAFTVNFNNRWTKPLERDYLSATEPGIEGWLPEPGGTVYNMQMGVFYKTFFKNPQAPWRYMLGFEPTFMPPENLKNYRAILRDPVAPESYEPWLKTMRRSDRIIVESNAGLPLPGVEWKQFGNVTWIGRLAAPTNAPNSGATTAAVQ